MYKNKAENGLNNISGSNIKKIRQALPGKVSQKTSGYASDGRS